MEVGKMYHFTAIVNYPEQKEVETPSFTANSIVSLLKLVDRLVSEEADATSFLITIVKK